MPQLSWDHGVCLYERSIPGEGPKWTVNEQLREEVVQKIVYPQ
jgi:hypothetical protein